jgi:hypothetical protein
MMGVSIAIFSDPSAEEDDEEPQTGRQELFTREGAATDDRGEYRIFGLQPGAYYIKASQKADPQYFDPPMSALVDQEVLRVFGSQYAPVFYPGVQHVEQADVVTLRPGEELQADFSMRRIRVSEVAGRVVKADGTPAAGANVSLMVPR